MLLVKKINLIDQVSGTCLPSRLFKTRMSKSCGILKRGTDPSILNAKGQYVNKKAAEIRNHAINELFNELLKDFTGSLE